LKAEDYNKQYADERVDHGGQPACSPPPVEVWRRIGLEVYGNRTTQISNLGRFRTVCTDGLINGGAIKEKMMKLEVDIYTRNLYFPLEEETL
jgi:hypothetical protein